MVRLDVKKVGHIPEGGGWRVHGRGSQQAKQARRARPATRLAVGGPATPTAIRHRRFSRLAYTEALPNEKARTAIGFVHRARAFFAAHGITHIHRIVSRA